MSNTGTTNEMDELTAMMAAQGLLTLPAADAPIGDEPAEITVEDEGETPAETIEAVAEIDELDAALADLAIEAAPEIEGGVETVEAGANDDLISDEALAGVMDELANEEAKHEVYAEQENTVTVEGAPDAPATATKAAKAPRAAAVPRTSRLAGSTHGAYVAAKLDDAVIEAAVDALPKKVKDKATNLVDHIKLGKELSVYTKVAVNMLKADGAISNASLVTALTNASKKSAVGVGYSIGTARSQAGQMMALFGKLGIATNDGAKGLVPNVASPLWQALAA